MEHILVANCEEYLGQYVATSDWSSDAIICASPTPAETYNKAVAQGITDPVLIYVPMAEEVNKY